MNALLAAHPGAVPRAAHPDKGVAPSADAAKPAADTATPLPRPVFGETLRLAAAEPGPLPLPDAESPADEASGDSAPLAAVILDVGAARLRAGVPPADAPAADDAADADIDTVSIDAALVGVPVADAAAAALVPASAAEARATTAAAVSRATATAVDAAGRRAPPPSPAAAASPDLTAGEAKAQVPAPITADLADRLQHRRVEAAPSFVVADDAKPTEHTATTIDVPTPALPPTTTTATAGRVDAPLRLPNGDPAGWRQPLAEALGERIHVQVGHGAERAVIRLDPPTMGSVEIVIRHEAGNVQVQLTATHGEVLRQLHGIADGLRQDLVGRQFADVSVHIADGSRDPDGRQRQGSDGRPGSSDSPGRALSDGEDNEAHAFTLA